PCFKSMHETTDMSNASRRHSESLTPSPTVASSAVGVVVATGDKTVFGRIARLTNKPKGGLTTLETEVLRFAVIIVANDYGRHYRLMGKRIMVLNLNHRF
ncbi:hypothetical protein BDR22DRAFT_830985, partial [Usnea florida]